MKTFIIVAASVALLAGCSEIPAPSNLARVHDTGDSYGSGQRGVRTDGGSAEHVQYVTTKRRASGGRVVGYYDQGAHGRMLAAQHRRPDTGGGSD